MDCDILVIGSGGAGLVAACAARRAGARVSLVTKSLAGLANCTAYAGGGFTLPYGNVSPEEHRSKTLEIGRFINIPHMLDALSGEAREKVPALAEFGVSIDLNDGHASVARYGLDALLGGTGMTLPLVEYARKSGVTIIEHTIVTGLFAEGSRITGVRAFSTESGAFSSIAARAVIVATGGAGRLYSRTDNPVRTTGDGFGLLAELGLPFIDMEFVQFYPMGFAEPDFPVWMIGLEWSDVASITNAKGEQFLRALWRQWGINNGREANAYTRDRSSIAIAREWSKGGEVLLHVEEAPPASWQTPRGKMIRKMFPPQRAPEDGPIRVKPVEHYFSGGAYVGPDCSTEAQGLFASGEVTGGTDGANRIGGNALSMITVFGFRAQQAALEYARSRPAASVPDDHPKDRLARTWSSNVSGPTPGQVKKEINAIGDDKLAVVRTARGLEQALSGLCEIESRLGEIRAGTPEEILEAYEAQNLITTGKMVARAALERQESRGVHFREDFPEENPGWAKHIEIRSRDGNLATTTFPA